MNAKHSWFLLLLFLLFCQSSKGQELVSEGGDSEYKYTLYFHVGKSDFDPAFKNNAVTMRRIVDQIDLLYGKQASSIRSIKVSTSTSPEGGKALNVRLASDRSHSIVRYLRMIYPRLTQQIVISSELAPDWDMLRKLVSEGYMPMRDEVISILDLYRNYRHLDYSVVDPREAQLRKLNNGAVWKYMLDNYFPEMRYAKVDLSHDLLDTSNSEFTEVMPYNNETAEANPPLDDEAAFNAWKKAQKKFLFALKTNLLFDAVGAFNGEIEVPIAPKWSIQAEAVWPWFVHSHDCWAHEMGLVDGEVRYWLGEDTNIGNPIDPSRKVNPLTGFFLGFTGGWGYYDFEINNKGYQGELIMAGLTGGYSKRLWHNFNLEFSLGLGYFHTKCRHYHAEYVNDDKYLVRKNYERYNWVGPVKAKISLSWLLFNK